MVWAIILATLAGAVSTALAGANATLTRTLGQPMTAAMIVLAVNAVPVLAWGVIGGGLSWPEAGRFAALPWWAWAGGLGGASILLAQLFLAQKLGAAPYTGITVTAGIVASIALDHYGWLGFERHPAQLLRLLGGVLMVGGLVLVVRN